VGDEEMSTGEGEEQRGESRREFPKRHAPGSTILTTGCSGTWTTKGVPHLEGEAVARDFSLVTRVLVA